MRPKPVAIFGSGPAGLLAAHAVALAGREFDIFALGARSELIGPQYLYQHIPEVSPRSPETYVRQVVRGTMTGYRRKQFGELDPGWIERPMAPGYNAWNLRDVYERLWRLYSSRIITASVSAEFVRDMLEARVYSRIFSTIPPHAFCINPAHKFVTWPVLIAYTNVEPVEPDTIVFNGEESPSWMRQSHIFGIRTVEWPPSILNPEKARSRPPIPDLQTFEKPLRTDCDCFVPEVRRMGRFGRWKNEIWAHDAYNEAKEVVGG